MTKINSLSMLPFFVMVTWALRVLPCTSAFQPSTPSRPVIGKTNLAYSSATWATSTPRESRIHMAIQESDGNDDKDEKDGIPSSPLDRPVLSLIDASVLFIFAAVGKASHSAVDGSLDVVAVLVTAFPFLLSWFATAPLLGCFTPMATGDIKQSVIYAAKGWALAVPLGCVLRGIIKGYAPPIPFVIVTLLATLVLLSAGRAAYTAASEVYVEMF